MFHETYSGFPADEVHYCLFVVEADGDGFFSQLDGISVDAFYMSDSYEVAAVYADELAGGEGLLEVVHGLVRDERIVRRMNLEVILHALYVKDLGEVDPEEFAVRSDKDMIAGWRRFLAGQRIKASVEQLVHGL